MEMTTKLFLGIGTSHENDVFDFIYNILIEHRPQAITLEERMHFTNIGENCCHWNERKEKLYANKSKIKYETTIGNVTIKPFDSRPKIVIQNIKKVKLFLDELCVLDGTDLEFNPVLTYALEKNIPFYFTDAPLYGTKDIVEFRPEDYRVISLANDTELTKELLADSLRLNDERRNKFAADVINYLFRTNLNCVAHVGGTAHFNHQYYLRDQWEPYDNAWQNHIQDFVKSDKTMIADSNTQIVYKFKG